MVKVVKFGGSSLASAEQFMKVGKIIKSDESRKYVVPSAPVNVVQRIQKSLICFMHVMIWQKRMRISESFL